MTIFAISDIDVFYISFDEPNCDANWYRIKDLHPDAKRIHGVIGFDRAHRTCALASSTKRFATIDGDNWVNDGTMTYVLDDTGMEDACLSFKSKNVINGLEYGNGGMKVWDKETFLRSNTHERANSTDFCWDIRYYQIDYPASTTVNNCSPYQAWRAGYREGVKMGYIDGKPLPDFKNDWKKIFKVNLSRLHIWASVGRDKDNGIWSILGARMAISDSMLGSNGSRINDYHWFREKWKSVCDLDPEEAAIETGAYLSDNGFYVPEFDANESQWVKMIYTNPKREGFMW